MHMSYPNVFGLIYDRGLLKDEKVYMQIVATYIPIEVVLKLCMGCLCMNHAESK